MFTHRRINHAQLGMKREAIDADKITSFLPLPATANEAANVVIQAIRVDTDSVGRKSMLFWREASLAR